MHKITYLIIFAMFSLPLFSYAETNIGDTVVTTVQKIAQDKFNKETGLDSIKDISEIDAGKIADKAVKYVRGDAPSAIMAELIFQMRDVQNTGLPNNFRQYTKKKPFNTKNACQRIANQHMVGGLDNANVKAQLIPWVDISWEAVKSIASGGKSLSDLIKENTKNKVEELIKTTLYGKAEPKIETVSIPSYDSCGSVTNITWDPVNMRIIVVTDGDCKCKLYSGEGVEKDTLKNYKVVVVAPVTVTNVRIEEKNYFIFWKKYNIQAKYKVGKLKVATDANCDCSTDALPPPPPQNNKGFFGRLWDWITGNKDFLELPKDTVLEKETTDDSVEKDTRDTSNENEIKDNEDVTDDESVNDTDTTDTETESTIKKADEVISKKEKEIQCGDIVNVDGRKGVQTFAYRNTSSSDVNFSCNNSCASDQVCTVLPESVGADRNSCVYCANKNYTPEEDISEPITVSTCKIPSNQQWNNALMPGFKHTVLDETRVLVENSNTFCGMSSLEEFKDSAERSIRFLNGSCATIKIDDFTYTDIKGSCSFIAYFK